MRLNDMVRGYRYPLFFKVGIAAISLIGITWLSCSEELKPPVARIVGPYTALVGAVVQLDGSQSTDPEGGDLSFLWSFNQLPPNSRAVINNPTLVQPAFVADREGSFEIQLVVSNGFLESLPVTHTVQVGPCGGHLPVVAAVSTDPAQPVVGDVVRFSAEVTDEDLGENCQLTQTFDYRWRLITVPIGSLAMLTDGTQSNPWLVVDRSGTYALQLIVTDSAGWSSEPFLFTFTVLTCGEAAPEIEAITANPANPALGEMTVLSATVVDADNQPACNLHQRLSYLWQLTEVPVGSLAFIERPDLEVTWFWPDVSGNYTITLVVTDSTGLVSQPAELVLTAGPCGDFPPVVEAVYGDPEEPDVGDIVTLTADVYDPDNEEGCDANQDLFYEWRIVAGPAGTLSRIEEPTWEETWFVPDLPGDYLVRLVVTDSTGLASEPGELLVTVGECGSRPPIIEGISADPLAPNSGDLVELTVIVYDEDVEDPCNDVSQYDFEWWFQEKPPGSLAAISDPRLSNPTFVADIPGDYVVNARVTDQRGLLSQVAQLVVTASQCGAAPPVATLTATPAAPIIGQPVLLRAEVTDADMDDGTEEDTCTLPESFTYEWRFVEMPPESLSAIEQAHSQNASFTPDTAGLYVIECLVYDAMGHRNVADDEGDLVVTVDVADCGDALPVIESITAAPEVPYTGEIVLLSAEVDDADRTCGEDQLFTYAWRFIDMPSGSLAELSEPGAENPWFQADTPGPYTVRLVVTDSTDRASHPGDFTVDVSPCGSAAPEVVEVLPIPDIAHIGQRVELQITVSDVDNNVGGCELDQQLDTVSWFVARPPGSTAELNPPEGLRASFVPDVEGDYLIRTRVTDSTGRIGEADTPVTATDCGGAAPVVDDVTITVSDLPPSRIDVGNLVTLTIAYSDADNTSGCLGVGVLQVLTVTSSFVSLPAGSAAVLSPAEGSTPSFVADVTGTYLVRTRVTDETGLFTERDTPVEVHECGSNPPIVSVSRVGGGEFLFETGDRVELLAQATDLDNAVCGLNQILTITSGFLTRPGGSQAEFEPAEGEYPAFVADVPGFYVVQTVAQDGTGRSSQVITLVEVTECGNGTPWVTVAVIGTRNTGEIIQLDVEPYDNDILTGDDECGLIQTLTVWSSFVARPPGSSAVLSPAEGTTPSFIPDVPGDYIVRTTVDDGTGRSSFEDTPIFILECGSHIPEILEPVIVAPAVPNVGDLVTLTVNTDDDDNDCGLSQVLTLHSAFLERPAGSTAVLSPAEGMVPAFVADVGGTYIIRATVDDGTGRSSFKDISVTVSRCGSFDPELEILVLLNDAPFDPADDHINAGDEVTLVVDASDPDNESIAPDNCQLGQVLTLHSQFVERPPTSAVELAPAEGSRPTFVPDVRGFYIIRTTVEDPTGRTAFALTELEVEPCGDNDPFIVPPITVTAVGGNPDAIDVGDLVTLGITATDDDTLEGCELEQALMLVSQFIRRPSGSATVLNPAEGYNPAFVPDFWGTYEIRTTVVDVTGRSFSRDTAVAVIQCGDHVPEMTITVTVDEIPVTEENPVDTGDLVTLDIIPDDEDNTTCGFEPPQTLTVISEFVSRPPGSLAVLSPAEGNQASFVADVNGIYVIRTTVSDGTGRSFFTDTTVDVRECGDYTPTIDPATIMVGDTAIDPPELPNTGDLVHLLLTADDEDNSGACCELTPPELCQNLTFTSWFLARPYGSTTVLSPAEGDQPTFLADRPGIYVIRSLVEDGTGRSASLDTTVEIDVCGSHPPVAQIDVVQPEDPDYEPGVSEAYIIPTEATVVLDGSGSTDGEDDCLPAQTLSYHWSFVRIPPGSVASFVNDEVIQPYFYADVPGLYEVELEVSDGWGTGTFRMNLVADPSRALVPGTELMVFLIDGGGLLWDLPEGVAWDSDSTIYTVQNGSDMVTQTSLVGDEWVTEPLTAGLYLNYIHDIVFWEQGTTDSLLVSSETDDVIVRLILGTPVSQDQWTPPGAVVRPAGIDLYTANTLDYLATIDQTAKNIVVFDSSGGDVATVPLEQIANSFLNPWGVAAEANTTSPYLRRFWATSTFFGYLERLTEGPANVYTYHTLTTVLTGPRDLLFIDLPPGENDALLVADTLSGRVLWVENCPSPSVSSPCSVVPLLSGLVRPYGLSFGPPHPSGVGNSVLVTDRGTNTLYQLVQTSAEWW